MATELKDDRVNIEITPTSVRIDSANVLTLVTLLSAIKLRLDIVEVVCARQAQTEYYDYAVTHRDGRRWEPLVQRRRVLETQ